MVKALDEASSIVLGGGCFWCLEAYFKQLNGVLSVVSGYAGGNIKNPSYSLVSSGSSGHAEVVQITYEPNIISLPTLLEIFFTMHNPTTPDQQGADMGSQYRSIILVSNENDAKTAFGVMSKMQKSWPNPIVTQVEQLKVFYPAENYHQNYYQNNSSAPYCQIVINPKLIKFKQKFSGLIKG